MDTNTINLIRDLLYTEAEELAPENQTPPITTDPALTNYNNKINKKIIIAGSESGIKQTNKNYNLGVALLTAHNIDFKKISTGEKTGFLTREKIGEEENTYSIGFSKSTSDSDYSQTNYGQRYDALLKRIKKSKFKGGVA